MLTRLANVSVLVSDYDEAIRWYTDVLGLELRMDGSMGGDYRFVTVGVPGQDDVAIVLHKGQVPAKGQPGLLFHTDDCRGDVARMQAAGVTVTLAPEEQPWGVQAVVQDPFGASHVLLQPSRMAFQRGRVRA